MRNGRTSFLLPDSSRGDGQTAYGRASNLWLLVPRVVCAMSFWRRFNVDGNSQDGHDEKERFHLYFPSGVLEWGTASPFFNATHRNEFGRVNAARGRKAFYPVTRRLPIGLLD